MVGTITSAANMALMMYHGLTHSAYDALSAHGSPQQKALYLPRLATGRWSGTMNLTEPQCGTDLGLVRTRAEPQPDGSHRITGQKIWISAGEHDLSENIIHLVLARTPQAPTGTRGLSMFVVPKVLVRDDGTLGPRNAVSCIGLERKMGIHANATCVMQYDGATGWLVGAENEGLRNMFTMMNEARLLVGMQGVAVAQAAYGEAAAHAKDRLQGRAVTGVQNPDGPADPLIVHPDVRRMLLEQRAFVEGGTAFLAWVATTLDTQKRHSDEAVRAAAAARVALLTPVIKGYLTEAGFDAATLAQQVFGGSGYVEDTGISQLVRDVRITRVYEGTTGIQALDLVGRKLGAGGGKAIMALFAEIDGVIAEHAGGPLAAEFLDPLAAAKGDLQKAAMYFLKVGAKDPEAALAGSVDFLHLLGLVCMGLCWTRMAAVAEAALAQGTAETAFHEAKLATGRFFMARMLPETVLRRTRIESGAGPVMGLAAEAF
jgi:alkylation response protein AidB-like acyl-CoA dehydrogenase